MNETANQVLAFPRSAPKREVGVFGRSRHAVHAEQRPAKVDEHPWLVDLDALSRCRALLAGHLPAEMTATEPRPGHQSLLHVPSSYDLFCRAHFASVRRLHPDLSWENACPAYAVALSAHAALCIELDAALEQQLHTHWSQIRGRSRLPWSQAVRLIADGCSALNRLDPLAMQR